jgi:hypothetical protein
MTFAPVLHPAILIAIAVVLIVMRVVALRRMPRTGGTGRRVRVARWAGVTLGALLLTLAAARPVVEGGDAASMAESSGAPGGSNVNVFFVVDRSVDTRVEDFGDRQSRMTGIRDDITTLIEHYPRARFAMISFASRASLDWPLSADVWSLKPMIAGLSSYVAGSADATYQVNAAAATDTLRYKLAQAQFQFPHSQNLVFYFGAGAAGSRAPQGSFDLGSAKVGGGAVLGYGTSAGGPIPQGAAGGDTVYVRDAQTGGALSSAVNEPALEAIARQLGVPYLHRENGQSIAPVIAAVKAGGAGTAASASGREPVELYWVFTLAAAALVLIEIYLTIRQFRRNRLTRADVEL